MINFKIKKKIVLSSIVLLLLMGVIIGTVLLSIKNDSNPLLCIGFIFIALFSIYAILKDTRIISVNKVVWYFCLIFMSIAPLCQFVSGYYPWKYKISEIEIAQAQLIVFLFYFIYFIFYNFVFEKKYKKTHHSVVTNYLCKNRKFSIGSQIMLFVFTVIAFGVLVKLQGFSNLFIRAENHLDIENSTLNFVIKKFLSSFPVMASTVVLFSKKRISSKVALSIMLFITLLANFPTTTSRYWMATILLGFFLAKFMRRTQSRILDFAILFAVVVLFPFFYIFKTKSFSFILDNGYSYSGIVESFNTIDFDAFTLLARAIRYVSDNGITWGQQLINIILFFIPRSIWKGKPITTNTLIASSQGAKYTNLSCPLPAEGYINFGIIGVVAYSIIIAFYCNYLDRAYWKYSKDGDLNIINMTYPYLAIIILYMSRGPLQPSFIQTIALVLPMIVIVFVFPNKKCKKVLEWYDYSKNGKKV